MVSVKLKDAYHASPVGERLAHIQGGFIFVIRDNLFPIK